MKTETTKKAAEYEIAWLAGLEPAPSGEWTIGRFEVREFGKRKTVEVRFWMKRFDEPSRYGIGKGRISKLSIEQDGECVYSYDRGLDIDCKTEQARRVLDKLIEEFN